MPHIFSTLANDQLYANWVPGPADTPIRGASILIRGGTGVANDRLITPLGVATQVTDTELAELEKNTVFLEHRRDGFIRVQTKRADPEKVASDMNLKDRSAPLTPADFAADPESPQSVLN